MVDQSHTPKEEMPSSALTAHSGETQFQHELAALDAVSWALSQSLDMDQVLESALETTLRVTDGQAGCIYMPAGPETYELRLHFHVGLPSDLAQCVEAIPQDDPEIQRIIASGEVVASDRCGAPPEPLAGDDSNTELGTPGVWACLPMLARGRFQGLMSILIEEFTPDRARLLKAVGQRVGMAIDNARLIQAERRQREVAEMLRDLVVTVNSTLDVDQVLKIAVHRLQALHQATACSVSFLEEDGETFAFRATTDPGIDVSQHITFPASGSIAGRAIRERKVQVVDNVDLSPDYHPEVARRTGIVDRSLLTAPLFADDQPLGVIQVLSASPGAFIQADAELLATTAALIETAIARAQAYAQAVQLARAEYHQREVAETLRQVAVLINASLDLDTVLGRILEQLAQVMEYDTASLMLVEGDQLSVRALRGFEESDRVLGLVSDISDNPLFQEMSASRCPILIPDVCADDRYQHWVGTSSVRSWIGVPLVVRDRVIGQLAVDKYQPDFYDQDDAELALTFAQQAAIAIENARLHAETQGRLQAQIALREAGAAISSTLELETVLGHIAERMGQAIDVTSAYIGDYQPETLTSTILAEYISPQACIQEQVSDLGVTYDLGQDFPGFIERILAGRPVIVHLDDPDLSEAERDHMQRYGARSVLTIPLQVRGQVVAYVDLWESRRRRGFTAGEMALCQDIAHQAAVAIENAQLFRAEQSQRQMAEALRQAGAALSSTLNYEEVIDRILEQVSQVVPNDAARIMLIEEGVARVLRWHGYERFGSEDDVALIAFEIANTPNLRTMQETGRPFTVPNVEDYEGWVYVPQSAWLRSTAGAPIHIRNQVIGFLHVDSATPGRFSQADAERLQAFANQAAIAIENAQLFDSERRQREIAESLQEVATTLSASLDLDTVLTRIMEQLRRVVEYDSAGVLLQDGDDLLISGGFGFPDPDATIGLRIPLSSDAPGVQIFKHQRPLIIADVRADPTWIQMSGVEYIRGWMGVPLLAGEKPIGVLTVDSTRASAYSQEDAQVVQSFANHAAIAIENARLFEAEQRQRRMAEALHRSALAVSSTMALDKVFQPILSELQNVVPYDSATVQLLKGEQLEIIGGRGFPNLSELLGVTFPARGDNPNALVMEAREPVIIDDVRPRYPAFDQEPHAAAAICSWLGVPLLIGDRAIGMLALDKRQPDFYNETHAQTAMAYAAQAAIAIENARLHQALQDYAAELETRVEARTAEVNREHERLLAVLENAGEAIVITNADGVIEYANPAWEKLTGHDVTQAIQDETRIIDEETFSDLLVAVRDVAQPQRIWRKEMVDQRPDGAMYVVDLTVTPTFDAGGALVNLIAVYRDITQYKELDRIKSEFLSTAAHELRSPLTSILGFSELLLLREGLSDEERAHFLEYIYDHALHLKELVSDLLDISRIESGVSFSVKLVPLDLHPLFEQEMQSWREAHPDHSYRLDAGRDWPQVQADKERIHQVMRNLLSNATKYSPEGGAIVVSATPVGGFMEVTVADEGIGMTSEELTHIFEKFWRADASSTAVEGTGLGLVIVKYIVERHGGQIWAKSAKGKGTVVHFTLPMVERQTTVLIVEDEDGVREIEHRILTNKGIATLLASNGQEAIEMAQAHRPDLILLDLIMPGMRGEEVLHILKSNPATQHIPVLVVSARSSWETIEESYMLGAVDFLTKPFEYQELVSRVRRALKIAAGNRQSAAGNQ